MAPMKQPRCKSSGCTRRSMRGSNHCFYCTRQRHRTPPQVAARQIAAITGDHDFEDAAE